MIWYLLAIYLHILAVVIWMGQVIYRTAVVEPLLKRLGSPEATRGMRDLHDNLHRLGWPALLVALGTGVFMLYYQGVTLEESLTGRLFVGSYGRLLQAKLLLTGALIVVQCLVETRRVALESLLAVLGATIIGLSTVLTR